MFPCSIQRSLSINGEPLAGLLASLLASGHALTFCQPWQPSFTGKTGLPTSKLALPPASWPARVQNLQYVSALPKWSSFRTSHASELYRQASLQVTPRQLTNRNAMITSNRSRGASFHTFNDRWQAPSPIRQTHSRGQKKSARWGNRALGNRPMGESDGE